MTTAAFNAAVDPTLIRFFAAVDNRDVAAAAAIIAADKTAVNWLKPVPIGGLPWGLRETGLMMAAANNDVPMMKLMVDNGAGLNDQQHRKWTALMYAADREAEAAVDYLLSAGADTNIRNEQGDDAAGVAARRMNTQLARVISNAMASHGAKFFEGNRRPLPAPHTARFRKPG